MPSVDPLSPLLARIAFFWKKYQQTGRMPKGMSTALSDLTYMLDGEDDTPRRWSGEEDA